MGQGLKHAVAVGEGSPHDRFGVDRVISVLEVLVLAGAAVVAFLSSAWSDTLFAWLLLGVGAGLHLLLSRWRRPGLWFPLAGLLAYCVLMPTVVIAVTLAFDSAVTGRPWRDDWRFELGWGYLLFGHVGVLGWGIAQPVQILLRLVLGVPHQHLCRHVAAVVVVAAVCGAVGA